MTTALSPRTNTAALAGKYLTFNLGPETYGISVLKVREILQQATTTAVPQMSAGLEVVSHLRGKIIPVVDLRCKFGLGTGAVTQRTCIVVVQVAAADATRHALGLLVDGVEEMTNIPAAYIEATPVFGVNRDTTYFLGTAKIKGVVKGLLDIDEILAPATHCPGAPQTTPRTNLSPRCSL